MILIVIIILLIILLRSNAVEGFDINEIRHPDTPLPKYNITTIKMPLPLQDFKGPAPLSTVLKELVYLKQLTQQRADKVEFCNSIIRGGVLAYYINYAGNNGLTYDLGHLTTVYNDTQHLCRLLKSYYRRPRPYQVSMFYGINIVPLDMPETSSYPCEYTMCAKVLALQLSNNNPEHSTILHGMAKKVELSRYYSGTNFPSDTVASLKIIDRIKNNIMYSTKLNLPM